LSNSSHQKHLVVFQPSGRRGYVDEGKTLLEAAQELGAQLASVCGGYAQCGKCMIKLIEGSFEEYGVTSSMEHLSAIGEDECEFLKKHPPNYRLSCAARIYGDVVIHVPGKSRISKQSIRKTFNLTNVSMAPAVKKYGLDLNPSQLRKADWECLQAELFRQYNLDSLSIDFPVLLELQKVLNRGDWKVTVFIWKDTEVIKVEPGLVAKPFGLAIDIGTTTISTYLCDLGSGELLSSESVTNPQLVYGEDVMSRITHAMANENGLANLNRTIIDTLNQTAEQVAHEAGIKCDSIVDVTVVGNTCMHHLFLGIHPECLGRNPFIPCTLHSLDIKARDLGLQFAPGAYVHMLPNIAAFLGSDSVGALIAEPPYTHEGMTLIMDIGTNGELMLGNRDRLIACSCATGPALEGASIKHGMRASPGAIEKLEIDPGTKEVRFKVIGKQGWSNDSEAVKAGGICGSGIIDAVAQMLKAGILGKSGRFNSESDTSRLRITEKGAEFIIAWAGQTSMGQDIAISQADVRAVQLAKGALYAGAGFLIRSMGIERPDRILLAGAFGNYIDKRSAAYMGLFPDSDLKDVHFVGNAAGAGALLALLNLDKRKEADKIAEQVKCVELTREPDFAKEFARACVFRNQS
jgi:uncharacterized 2Fe-2S/4Fe-4S cluster protein (DUF4445 family)